jgi:adenosylcobinamide amidohydrolase
VIALPQSWQVLSCAPFRGGSVRARTIVNHQIEAGDRAATENPARYLAALVRAFVTRSESAVAMMTGVDVRTVSHISTRRGDLTVAAWCTAGCSNALRIGDPATAGKTGPGTINLVVTVNQPLTRSAMVEALAMATEARVAAVGAAGVASTRTRRPATGTGTDCVAIASPLGPLAHPYCGKHTLLGELIGKAAIRSCANALRRHLS